MHGNFQHYSIMVVDVVGFGRRDDRFQQRIRQGLVDVLRYAFVESHLVLDDMTVEDRGDGKAILIPSSVSKMRLIDPLLDRIEVSLRQHNEAMSEQGRIRLRLALHAGEIAEDASGWVGSELNAAFRLVNSAPVRTAIQDHPDAALAVIVSDLIYQQVVRHGHGAVRPSDYARVSVAEKDLAADAWVRVVGRATSTPTAVPAEPRPSQVGHAGATFNGSVNIGQDFVHGDKHVGRP